LLPTALLLLLRLLLLLLQLETEWSAQTIWSGGFGGLVFNEPGRFFCVCLLVSVRALHDGGTSKHERYSV
jgi:hypothetical protein